MNRLFIIGDLNLFSRAAARQANKNIREYNKFAIQRINESVEDEDCLLLCGIINEKEDNTAIELLKKIKCKIIILSKDDKFQKAPWDIFERWGTDGWSHQKNYNGDKIDVIYLCDKNFILNYTLTERNIIAAPTSMLGFKDKIKMRFLNNSFEALDYYPLEVKYIARRFEDLELFEKMSNQEENYAEQTI